MGLRDSYSPGTMCWADLGTPDVDAARRYYGELLGWSFEPLDPEGDYEIATLDGRWVAGLYEAQAQASPAWESYACVEDVDTAVARAESLGGTIVAQPADVTTSGRMAVIADPLGATVRLWQARDHIGAQRVNDTGCCCWNELMTTDLPRASDFYRALFDWSVEPFGDSYSIFVNGERPAGGLMAIDEEVAGSQSPAWLIYFAVDDCDAAAARSLELGGSTQTPPADFPEVGRGAVLVDPQGATFSVIHLLDPPD